MSDPHGADYQRTLTQARAHSGVDEAVLTGAGRIGARPVAVIASEFSFLAGSIGIAASNRIACAIDRATREKLPLLASPASGGTRLQEGTPAFAQMIRITVALAEHRGCGLPYLVYLRHPTTGGVLASWGAMGHVTAAEPGALIGLLGPRVHEVLYGNTLPAGVQTAENLHAHGLVDAVVAPEDLREVAIRVLAVLAAPASQRSRAAATTPARSRQRLDGGTSAWDSVLRSRRPDRPGVRALLKVAASDVTPLSGTGAGERDPAIVLALARFGEQPCVLLGHDRRRLARSQLLGPAGLREAMRAMRLAADIRLPLVTVIDTPGVALSREAEEGGLAAGIARCLAELVGLPSPTVCILLGQGGGGAALAFLPADRVLCAEHAWLAALPPEGAAQILYRTSDRVAEVAERQRIASAALLADGIVDRVVPELPDAADEAEAFLRRLGRALESEIAALIARDPASRLAQRAARYRNGPRTGRDRRADRSQR